jgi:hypothetical protein
MMWRLLTSFVLFSVMSLLARASIPVVHATAASPESPATYAIQAVWHAGIIAREPAVWAKTLSDEQQHTVGQALKQSGQTGTGFGDTFGGWLMPLFFLSVPGYPILQIYAFFRLRGPRRLLSALPLSFMLPTYAFCLYALSRDSNLWPLYAIFLSPIAILIVWGMLWHNRRNPSVPAG